MSNYLLTSRLISVRDMMKKNEICINCSGHIESAYPFLILVNRSRRNELKQLSPLHFLSYFN